MHWQWLLGGGCAFLLAFVTASAGVSGAVMFLPFQVGNLLAHSRLSGGLRVEAAAAGRT